jgi:hypothetical protein
LVPLLCVWSEVIAIQWHNLQTVEVGHYSVEVEVVSRKSDAMLIYVSSPKKYRLPGYNWNIIERGVTEENK